MPRRGTRLPGVVIARSWSAAASWPRKIPLSHMRSGRNVLRVARPFGTLPLPPHLFSEKNRMFLRQTSTFRTVNPFGRKSAYRVAALALALVVSAACSDDTDETTGPTTQTPSADIQLSESSVTLVRGATTTTKQINATVTGSANGAVTWTSFDPRVATVSQTGMVTAVADGQTHITATMAGDPSVNRSVVVNVVSTIITVAPAASFSYVGGPSRTIAATIKNNPNTAVTWRSSNEAVATVSAAGVVSPVGTGTTDIIARSAGDPTKEAAMSITIDPAPLAGFTQLTSGQQVNVAGNTGDNANFYIVVPPGATRLTAALTGPTTQDADLYVYRGNASAATLNALSNTGGARLCNPWLADTNETCTINNPDPRIYYIVVNAYTAYQNGKLTVTIQ